MVCWKPGVDPESSLWNAGRQGRNQWVYHGKLGGRGGIRRFIIVYWKAGMATTGLTWHAGRQRQIQKVYHGMLKGTARLIHRFSL